MNGIYYARFADLVSSPPIESLFVPMILVIGVITLTVLLIRNFKGKKK